MRQLVADDAQTMQLRSATFPVRADRSVVLQALAPVSFLLASLALSAQGVGQASSGDVQLWAVNAGWTLAGVVALGGTLAAALRLERGTRVQSAWFLWAAAIACWLIGAFVRDGLGTDRLSLAADVFWIACAVLAVAGSAYRVPPSFLFQIFLLDALPVVLLAVVAGRVASGHPPDHHLAHEMFLDVYPALYGVLAALAAQVFGILRHLRRDSATIWLLTLGFGLTGLAALLWVPAAAESGTAQGHWADPLWTLGLLVLALAGLLRAHNPDRYVDVPPREKDGGLHALPPAGATVGLIVMLLVVPERYHPLLYAVLLVAVLALSARFYLVRRQGEQLLAEVLRSREEAQAVAERVRQRADSLRRLVESSSRLTSLELEELLQAICDVAREVIGARYAALAPKPTDGLNPERFITSGIDEAGRARIGQPPQGLGLLGVMFSADGPVRLERLSEHPASIGFPAHHPPMESFLGVPIREAGSICGALYLTEKAGGFDEEDEALVQMLAADAGYAIENAKLYAQSRAQQEQLAAQNERLRELDRLKDEFVALVSHELRTPLTSIIGYLELVEDPDLNELDDEQRRFLGIVERNAQRLLRLVGDLLFLAQLQANKLTIELGEVDLAALAADAVEAARPAAERKHVALSLSAQPIPNLAGDRARIAQLLDNVLSNAVKFTPEGGQVDVTVRAEQESAVLEIADTGIGISAEDQAQLFDRFFRTEAASKSGIQGTGLGLTITKAIVEAHHGTISVKSEEGHGTVFRVELPLRRPEVAPTPDLKPSRAEPR